MYPSISILDFVSIKMDTTDNIDTCIRLIPTSNQQSPMSVNPTQPLSRYSSRGRKYTQFPNFVYSTYYVSFYSFLTSIYSFFEPSSYKESILALEAGYGIITFS